MSPTTIRCPSCSTDVPLTNGSLQADAAGFCPHCDYPLFFAPTKNQLVVEENTEASLRRLPGTGGHVIVGKRTCPNCGENNEMKDTVTHCWRCDALLDPPPPPPKAVEQPPPPPPPAPPPAPEPRNWWPWILGGVTAALLIVLLIVWLW